MKIVIIGGTGLIGAKTVDRLRKRGHDVVAASPTTGVNTVTGEGVTKALKGTSVVIDLANSPSFEDKAAMEFFEASGRNLLSAGVAEGVKHHIALSVVGTDRLQASGYFRAKQRQEELIRQSGLPFTIVHSTQFFEFTKAIAESGMVEGIVRLPPATYQPIASDDVADIMAEIAVGPPANRIIEIAGPDRVQMSDLVAGFLKAAGDARRVVADKKALYFGLAVDNRSLVPAAGARIGAIHFDGWLKAQHARESVN